MELLKPKNVESATCAKLNEPGRENEDAKCVREKAWAVSDGAGGTGAYSGAWASYLIKHLPEKAFHDEKEINAWIGEIWEDFYSKYAKEAESAHYSLQNKFQEQGSAATLVALWHQENDYAWASYGDSCLLYWSANQLHFFPQSAPKDFAESPFLLNWNDENLQKEGFKKGLLVPKEGDSILLCSDALGLYLSCAWANSQGEESQLEALRAEGGRLAEVASAFLGARSQKFSVALEELWEAVRTESTFQSFCKEKYNEKLLLQDDYSLIFIQF
jgi:hypothetical protein